MLEIIIELLKKLRENFKPVINVKVNKSEVLTMIEIWKNPGQTIKYYVNAVNLEYGSFTYLADKLVKKGMIERINMQDDKREKTLKLTGKGLTLAKDIHKQFTNHLSKQLGVLNSENFKELNNVIQILDKISKKLDGER